MRSPLHFDRFALQPGHSFPHRVLAGVDDRPLHPGSSDTAYSTLADLGILNVASNPGTRLFRGLTVVPFGDRPPDPGAIPASTARRSAAATSPSRPNLAAPPPTHTPAASPAPV